MIVGPAISALMVTKRRSFIVFIGVNWVIFVVTAHARLLIGREIPGVIHIQRRVKF